MNSVEGNIGLVVRRDFQGVSQEFSWYFFSVFVCFMAAFFYPEELDITPSAVAFKFDMPPLKFVQLGLEALLVAVGSLLFRCQFRNLHFHVVDFSLHVFEACL